jgi:hypothetical protein
MKVAIGSTTTTNMARKIRLSMLTSGPLLPVLLEQAHSSATSCVSLVHIYSSTVSFDSSSARSRMRLGSIFPVPRYGRQGGHSEESLGSWRAQEAMPSL